jgi:protein involved in polysaccharide export with SLBB domain
VIHYPAPVRQIAFAMLIACAIGNAGCQLTSGTGGLGVSSARNIESSFANQFVPRELDKVTTPMYRIEAPDVLTIDVQQNISQQNHLLQAGDVVSLRVGGAFPDEPIAGDYQVGIGGEIELGFSYGLVDVAGQSTAQATAVIQRHLSSQLKSPEVSMSLRSVSGIQPISGEHIVGPDGTVTLGQYGSVRLAGLTLDEARMMIANQLAPEFVDPKVSISVFAYNSKAIYVVTQGGGLGDDLVRLPYTGNETVMDALSQINGTTYVSSSNMWIARPSRDSGQPIRLPIDWEAITQNADVRTNYQLLPGDRVFIAHDKMVAIDSAIAKFTSPLERILGFTLLGTGTASRLSGNVLDNNSLGGGFAR